jgi:hypothetical protein
LDEDGFEGTVWCFWDRKHPDESGPEWIIQGRHRRDEALNGRNELSMQRADYGQWNESAMSARIAKRSCASFRKRSAINVIRRSVCLDREDHSTFVGGVSDD